MAVLVKGDNAETLGVVDKVAEHGAAAGGGVGCSALEPLGETGAVEDVVAQNHGAAVVADELLAQNERLCQAVRAGLYLVLQVQAVLAAVPQQGLKTRGVGGGGNDQDVLDAGQHQGGQRVVDHRFVVNGQQLLGGDHRQRVKSGAGAAGKDNTFHRYNSLFYIPCAPPIPRGQVPLGHNLTQ